MPCRVVAKRRQKKGKNRPLFAFCAVLPTEQENTQPALQTLLTNGKIDIVQLLSQQSFHLSVHLLPYKRKPKSTLTAYEKEPHSDVLDRPVIGMWLFRFLIVCTAVFLVMLYTRLSFIMLRNGVKSLSCGLSLSTLLLIAIKRICFLGNSISV